MPSTVAPTAPTAAPTAPGASGGCVMQTDCSVSAWCSDPTYASWCANHDASTCPEPQCVVADGASPTVAPVPTAAPTAPTAAPTTPTVAPTAAPTAPTASPAGGAADCGSCSTCLASNGVCYDQPQSWCGTFSFTWCGA